MPLPDALDAPDVFGPLFPSPSWDAWRTFCRALCAAPMSDADLDVFRACTGRQEAPAVPASEAWVVAGRRSGKSRIASAIAAHTAALAPTDRLAPGEVGTVLVCATTREQARVIFNYIQALFEVPTLRPLVVEQTAESITLRHRVRIEVRSSNFRSVRGLTLLCAVVDEIAFLRDESSAVPDVELYRALKPALATTGGLIVGISSPWAQRGLLWTKYRKHFGQDGAVLVWQAASRVMHPALSAELIADAHEDDPQSAVSEWDGAFRADLESYISQAAVDAITTPNVVERPPVPGITYAGFVDAAAGSGRDSFVAAVAHAEVRENQPPLIILDAVREVRPKFDPQAVAAELAAFLASYGITVAQSDKYAGAWVTTAFAPRVHVQQDAEPKSALYLAALPILTAGRADLLDLPRLRTQLVGLERRRRAGGRDVVDHSPGAHDDVANAVAGALVRADLPVACEPHMTRGVAAIDWNNVDVDGTPRQSVDYLSHYSGSRWRDW
jgi:hypothetical protein